MRANTTTEDTSVDRLLKVAAHKIACQYNLADACKLAHAGPETVARIAGVYRKEAARMDDGARYMYDAMMLASQYAVKLLQAARGTRPDLPGHAHWALLMAALASVAMAIEPAAHAELATFVDTLAEELSLL